jgi:hypothetical protein
MERLKEKRKRTGFLGGIRNENISCYACGSKETRITTTGYALWKYNDDPEGNALCNRCFLDLKVESWLRRPLTEEEKERLREILRASAPVQNENEEQSLPISFQT